MNRYFTCLWDGKDLPAYSGGQYNIQYVVNLIKNIHSHDPDGSLYILVDEVYQERLIKQVIEKKLVPLTKAQLIPFVGWGVGGWSRVLEIFRPDLCPMPWERCLAIGLDTVFVNDPSWLFRWDLAPVGLPLDPFQQKMVCDAVINYSKQGAGMIWARFMKERCKNHMQDCLFGGRPSEMVLLRHMWEEEKWPPFEPYPNKLLSYKVHVRSGCHVEDAVVVYFHGVPKPADLSPQDPIRKQWEA